MKKQLKYIIPISFAFLTSLITLNTDLFILISSMVLSFSLSYIIIRKYKFDEKIYNFPPFINKKIDILISSVFSFFTLRYVLRYYSYNKTPIEELSYKIAEYFNISHLKTDKIIMYGIGIIALISIYFIIYSLIKICFPKIKNFILSWNKKERYFFIITTFIVGILIGIIYMKTNAFYFPIPKDTNKVKIYDVIYTTDTGIQINSDSYKNFAASENDIRQPLFALFSYPFGLISGIAADVSSLVINNTIFVYAFCIAMWQVMLLSVIAIMLSRLIKIKNPLLFCILYAVTFPFLLFSLNVEQYIFALFWLILLIYIYIKNDKFSVTIFLASMGSLLTNAILCPFMIREKNLKKYILKGIECGLLFLALIIIFGQLDSFINQIVNFKEYTRFMGKTITWTNKLFQWTNFVSSCFIAPASYINLSDTHPMYLLSPVSEINVLGIVLFIITVISFIINRKDKFCKIAFGWEIYSIIILLIIGWGTMENGLIIYTLYFSWAYLVLLYKLISKIKEKSKIVFYIIITIIIIVMLYLNIRGILDIIKYGIEYYPTK